MKTRQEINLLKTLKLLNGKVKYLYTNGESRAILKINNKYYDGYARTSTRDKFDRKIARVITLGRALDNFNNKTEINSNTLHNYAKFREDVEQ